MRHDVVAALKTCDSEGATDHHDRGQATRGALLMLHDKVDDGKLIFINHEWIQRHG